MQGVINWHFVRALNPDYSDKVGKQAQETVEASFDLSRITDFLGCSFCSASILSRPCFSLSPARASREQGVFDPRTRKLHLAGRSIRGTQNVIAMDRYE